MKAASLLCVFISAKVAVLGSIPIAWSIWTPFVLLWQDAAFILSFALLERIPRLSVITAVIYWTTAVYIAINVPIVRMFSTPLTWPMLRATRGTLADSIQHHVDMLNVAGIALVIITAAVTPLLLRYSRCRVGPGFYLTLAAGGLLGFCNSSAVESTGLRSNWAGALIVSGREQVKPVAADTDWRNSASAASSSLGEWRGTATGRNVVLVLLESAGARHLKPYGSAVDTMPNLTRLADSAIVFDSAYAVYPESIKGLFSILASRYPAIETKAENYRRIGHPSLPEVLGKAGYRTALFHSGRFMYLGMDDIIADRGYEEMYDAGAIGGEQESSFGVEEPATVQRIIDWLEKASGPFFLTYLPTAGHHPYLTPEPGPFPDHTDRQRYLNALRYGDDALGELIAGMKRLGKYDNSLFIFCGDHGEAFGEHAGNYGHTLHIYEENMRVPLIISAPGLVTAQHRVPDMASVVDLAPTILDVLGLHIPSSYQGVSLLTRRPRSALFFTDYATRQAGLRDGHWKYIYEFETDRSRLYNLERDPMETVNLHAAFPHISRNFESRVKAWVAAQKQKVLAEPNNQQRRLALQNRF